MKRIRTVRKTWNRERNTEKEISFLDSEKNMLDYMKTFITISFMLNAGGIVALVSYRNEFFPVIIYLISGTIISISMYTLSLLFLIISATSIKNYSVFINSRIISYVFIFLGVFSSAFSFFHSAYEGIKIIAKQI